MVVIISLKQITTCGNREQGYYTDDLPRRCHENILITKKSGKPRNEMPFSQIVLRFVFASSGLHIKFNNFISYPKRRTPLASPSGLFFSVSNCATVISSISLYFRAFLLCDLVKIQPQFSRQKRTIGNRHKRLFVPLNEEFPFMKTLAMS